MKSEANCLSGKNKVESEKKKPVRLPYGTIGRILLGTVAVAGVLTVGLAAPGIFQAVKALEKQYKKDYRRYRVPAYARKVVQSLVNKKLVTIFQGREGMAMRLTEKGERELLRYQLREKPLESHRWDKKWRLVIFDIAEKRRYARDRVRQDMQSFGFVKLQDSVWAYPYECEQVVTLLKAQYKIGKELVYIVAGEIEGDESLKKKFQLS